MILNFKYHGDTGRLVPDGQYTLAQDNHLSDTIVVTSSADDCRDYEYCLDFVCYNSKNIPKMQYMSPTLEYGEQGIRFDVPNQLTQFRGHVDMQLIGYRKSDNRVVFKSTVHDSKAWDVEGSLNVLDSHLSDTPNILTELKQELDYFRESKDRLLLDYVDALEDDFSIVLGQYHYHRIEFRISGKIAGTRWCVHGSKLPVQEFPIPIMAQFEGEWYVQGTDRRWIFDRDVVDRDLVLIANIYSIGVAVREDTVVMVPTGRENVYLPRMRNGRMVTAIQLDNPTTFEQGTRIYLPDTIANQQGLERCSRVAEWMLDRDHPYFCVSDGALYTADKHTLIRIADETTRATVAVDPACIRIGAYALAGLRATSAIALASVTEIGDGAMQNDAALSALFLPTSVRKLGSGIVRDCPKLATVFCQAYAPPAAQEDTFDEQATLYVPSESADAYRKSAWGKWTIATIGQDFASEIERSPYYDVLYDKWSDDPKINRGFPNGLFQDETMDFTHYREYDMFAIHIELHSVRAPHVLWISHASPEPACAAYCLENRGISIVTDPYMIEDVTALCNIQITDKTFAVKAFHYEDVNDMRKLGPNARVPAHERAMSHICRIWGFKVCRK